MVEAGLNSWPRDLKALALSREDFLLIKLGFETSSLFELPLLLMQHTHWESQRWTSKTLKHRRSNFKKDHSVCVHTPHPNALRGKPRGGRGGRDGSMRGMVTKMGWVKKYKASAIWSPPSWWVRDHPGLGSLWCLDPQVCLLHCPVKSSLSWRCRLFDVASKKETAKS